MEKKDRNDLDISENVDSAVVKDRDEPSKAVHSESHSHEHEHHDHDHEHHDHDHHDHHDHDHEHHGHHGHHGSSSSRHKRKNKKLSKSFKHFVKQNKKQLICLAIVLAVFICLALVGMMMNNRFTVSDDKTGTESNAGVTQSPNALRTGELQIGVPFFDEEVVIVGPAVEAFMNADSTVPVSDIYDQYRDTSARLDIGLPVELSYNVVDIPEGYSVKSAEYLVADNSEFHNPYVYHTDGSSTKVDVYHLKTGTQYYYRINLTMNNDTETSVCGSFKTASGPRVLTVDGVYNLRDIGGWKTADGNVIKQGLLYRGCEIDGSVESKYKITSDGVNTMLTVLGIKTDMDLRVPTDNKYGTDALGAGVKHDYYSAPMYAAIFNSKENTEKIRKIFSDLADESNYPIYLHCTYGQDRTGTICYLLECLLGVDEESMMKDYQLSGLHHGDISSQDMSEFVEAVKSLPGYTLTDKVEGWLLSIGVTQEEIDNIRENFVE